MWSALATITSTWFAEYCASSRVVLGQLCRTRAETSSTRTYMSNHSVAIKRGFLSCCDALRTSTRSPCSTGPRRTLQRACKKTSVSVFCANTARKDYHRGISALNGRTARPQDKQQAEWWREDERSAGLRNVVEVHSEEEYDSVIATASLNPSNPIPVVVEFFSSWCNSCRLLYPKLLRIVRDEQDVLFVKVNFDVNKELCKRLGVRVSNRQQFHTEVDSILQDSFVYGYEAH